MNPFLILVRNLALTVLIEGVLVYVFTKNGEKTFHSVLVNMITNPILNVCLLLWLEYVALPVVPYYYIVTAFLEISAVITEWILYYKMGDFGLKKAFFAALSLNAASFSFGLLLG